MLLAAVQLGDAEVTSAGAAALEQLVGCAAGKLVIKSSGVPACVQLLTYGNEDVQLHALRFSAVWLGWY